MTLTTTGRSPTFRSSSISWKERWLPISINTCSMSKPLQSTYRAHHSIEATLIKIINDLLTAADSVHISILILLDLCQSAAECRVMCYPEWCATLVAHHPHPHVLPLSPSPSRTNCFFSYTNPFMPSPPVSFWPSPPSHIPDPTFLWSRSALHSSYQASALRRQSFQCGNPLSGTLFLLTFVMPQPWTVSNQPFKLCKACKHD